MEFKKGDKKVHAEQIKSVFGNPQFGWRGFLENGLKWSLPKELPEPNVGDYLVAQPASTELLLYKKGDFEAEHVRA